MKRKVYYIGLIFFAALVFTSGRLKSVFNQTDLENLVIYHQVDLNQQKLRFFSKDSLGKPFGNHGNLQSYLANKDLELVFAMNGGMFLKNMNPQGIYIEDFKKKASLDTVKMAYGNFYLQPNGVFYLTQENEGFVCETEKFSCHDQIKYATQSGPMLVVDGEIHAKFTHGSKNLHIRNGVGVLPNGNMLFAMSKAKINFYDFASFFKNQGCQNALYLDGFVSRTFLPAKNWEQIYGNFGIIIAEVR